MTTSKTCPLCEETKDRSAFSVDATKADGLQSLCMSCRTNHNDTRMFVNGKYVPRTSPLYKPGRYKSLDDAFSHNQLESVMNGYVYAMINPAFPGWVKVGKAVSMSDRENSYQTGDPHRGYKMIGGVYSEDNTDLERRAHIHLEHSSEERKGEWFKINEVHALNIIKLEARHMPCDTTSRSTPNTNGKVAAEQ